MATKLYYATCPVCGEKFEVDPLKERGVCAVCGAEYITNDVIDSNVTVEEESAPEVKTEDVFEGIPSSAEAAASSRVKSSEKITFTGEPEYYIGNTKVPLVVVEDLKEMAVTNRLEAIKFVVETGNLDLKQAKDIVVNIDSVDFTKPQLGEASPAPAKKGGCYVATCVYGSYDCPEVWTLRRFRDEDLGKVWYGRAFIRTYYAVSPTLVKLFGGTRLFRAICKAPLDGMVRKLRARGFEDTPYEDKAW